jgi:multidrug resistance efflux pump
MPESDIEKPRRRFKALGVMLAGFVAVVSVALVAVTQEPKKAVSSPVPAKAAIVPQIADAKSELEIHLRGKSFPLYRRAVVLYQGGVIEKLFVNEGDKVEADKILAEYKLDPQALAQVYNVVKSTTVDNSRKAFEDTKIALNKLTEAALPIKKSGRELVHKELENLRKLRERDYVQATAVENMQQRLNNTDKELLDLNDSIKQTREALPVAKKNFELAEGSQKKALELLQWQTNRSYDDPNLPLEKAFLKAPISGYVIRIAPELRVNAQLPAGFQAMVVAPIDSVLVRCKVHELDLVKLKTGDRATAIFDAISDKRFSCKIDRIPWTSRNPALEVPADYDIECLLDENPGGIIKDGYTCTVKVSVQQ